MNADIRLHFVTSDPDHRGNPRWYFRRPGQPKVRLPGIPGSQEFMATYQACLDGQKPERKRPTVARAVPGTLQALVQAYYASAAFKRLDGATQIWRRRTLDKLCQQVGKAGVERGTGKVANITQVHIKRWRDEIVKPGAANQRLKALKAMFAWAFEAGEVDRNPCIGVNLVRYAAKEHHSWTADEMRTYVKRHPFGTTAYRAFAILTSTAGRREDAVRLGPKHVVGERERLRFIQAKNEHRKAILIDIPMHPVLKACVEDIPAGQGTFLVTAYGQAFTPAGFGMRFRAWCDEANLKHCSAHGLRKATAALLAEAGATPHEIMAITGHRTLEEVERYTRAARQSLLADSGFTKLLGVEAEKSLSHTSIGETIEA
jgi:integrase/recombinase XerD